MSEWIEDKTPKSRKDHLCYLCEKSISKGEVHVHRTCVDQGQFFKFRMHPECEKVAHKFYDYMDWESHDVGCFREMLGEPK